LPHNSDWVVGRFLIAVSTHPDLDPELEEINVI
jgi:hypothetical protein